MDAVNTNMNDTQMSDVISENTKINGDFQSAGNIEIRGTINGNVSIEKCLILHEATIGGDITANDIYMDGGFVHGSISAIGTIDINGVVEGPIEGDNVIIRKNSVVKGDYIHCQSIALEGGAQVDCKIKTGYIKNDDAQGNDAVQDSDKPMTAETTAPSDSSESSVLEDALEEDSQDATSDAQEVASVEDMTFDTPIGVSVPVARERIDSSAFASHILNSIQSSDE